MGSDFEMPREVALAWGADRGRRRGRKPRLDLDRIAAAAIAVADAEGLAAVAMNRVATDLGVSPMSLYRYVRSKDELVQLMADAALGYPDIPDPLGCDWRANLKRWARGASGRFRAHPWITEIPVSQLPAMPRNIAWMDYALRILAETPLTHQERLSVIVLLNGHARTEAATRTQLAQGEAGSGRPDADQGELYARTLDAVVDADRFPALRVVVDEHILSPDDATSVSQAAAAEEMFLFGLDRILDGIQALIDRRGKGSR